MRLTCRNLLLVTACLLMVAPAGFAGVITFSNLSDGIAVPNGYAGMDWSNFYVMNAVPPPGNPFASAGIATMPLSFAVNKPGTTASFGSSTDFTFTSAWLGTEWTNRLALDIVGLNDTGNVVDRKLVMLTDGSPLHVIFDWKGIDQVQFIPIGAATSNGSLQFAVTEIAIGSPAPEPATLFLLAPGLGFVAARMRRMRHAK